MVRRPTPSRPFRTPPSSTGLPEPRAGRPGLSRLSLPSARFDPIHTMPDFETKADARFERDTRVKLLAATKHSGRWGNEALALAASLDEASAKHPIGSLADPFTFRDLRRRILGASHELIDENWPCRCSFFTIVQKAWARHPGEIPDVDLDKWKRAFRRNLTDAGGTVGDGWLLGTFEAAYDPGYNCYQFHIHGVATDSFVSAIDRMRDKRPYQPWVDVTGIPDCPRPIKLRAVSLADLPRPAGYSFKPYWKLRNAGPAIRLQGDEHTRVLLWLHERRIEDLSVLIGINVKEGRLCET